MQPIERADDEAMRLLAKVGLELDDLTIEQRAFGAGALAATLSPFPGSSAGASIHLRRVS